MTQACRIMRSIFPESTNLPRDKKGLVSMLAHASECSEEMTVRSCRHFNPEELSPVLRKEFRCQNAQPVPERPLPSPPSRVCERSALSDPLRSEGLGAHCRGESEQRPRMRTHYRHHRITQCVCDYS